MMEPSQSEMNILSNGKGHDPGDATAVPLKSMLEEDQWVSSLSLLHWDYNTACAEHGLHWVLPSFHTGRVNHIR